MNVMVGTFLMKKTLFPILDWIQSMKKIFKRRCLRRFFLLDILKDPPKTSCHLYSV
jgi:hypothetical protein